MFLGSQLRLWLAVSCHYITGGSVSVLNYTLICLSVRRQLLIKISYHIETAHTCYNILQKINTIKRSFGGQNK